MVLTFGTRQTLTSENLLGHLEADMGQLVGYARTSTVDQEASFEHQQTKLKEAGCEKIFAEQVSAVSADREQFKRALDYVREGDVLVATKLDRIARSVTDLSNTVEYLKGRGVGLRILGTDIDTTTPHGSLMLNMLGAFAQFERDLLLERQRVGIAKAKADGKYKGRKPTAREQADRVLALSEQGVPKSEIAKRLGIGRSSVYRIIQDAAESASG